MQPDPNRTVNVAVQVLPMVPELYPVVDRAIQVIQASGVKYEVGPMETTMEGPLDRLPIRSPFHGAVQVEDFQLVPLLKLIPSAFYESFRLVLLNAYEFGQALWRAIKGEALQSWEISALR